MALDFKVCEARGVIMDRIQCLKCVGRAYAQNNDMQNIVVRGLGPGGYVCVFQRL